MLKYILTERDMDLVERKQRLRKPSTQFRLEHWIASLKKIEAMDVDIVVPGHGRVGDKKDVHEFRLFIEKCLDLVREGIRQGMSREEAAARISFESMYPPVHPGADQQRLNVLRLYDALSNQAK